MAPMEAVAATVPARASGPSLAVVPDEVLTAVLEAHPSRCQLRAVAPRVRRLVEDHFQIRHFEPPVGKVFSVDFEINQHMTKHLYCANFGGESAGDAGGVAGAVTFLNWMPAYYRSAPHASRDVRHHLAESDGCTLWRLLAKVRDQRSEAAAASSPPARDEEAPAARAHAGAGSLAAPWQLQGRPPKEGYLTITEGRPFAYGGNDGSSGDSAGGNSAAKDGKREVIGMLSPVETELVLSVLDHRRNAAAQPAPSRQEIFAA